MGMRIMQDRYMHKAKRKDNGEWVKGYLLFDEFDREYRIIQQLEYSTGTHINSDRAPRVLENTICRCTGLKDRNGTVIWENDIVKEFNAEGEEWCIAQIIFADYSLNLGWCSKGLKSLNKYKKRLFNVGFGENDAVKCEVIGSAVDGSEKKKFVEVKHEKNNRKIQKR